MLSWVKNGMWLVNLTIEGTSVHVVVPAGALSLELRATRNSFYLCVASSEGDSGTSVKALSLVKHVHKISHNHHKAECNKCNK